MARKKSFQIRAMVDVVNAPRASLHDLYQMVLEAPWWVDVLALAALYLLANVLFGLAYMEVGGIHGAQPGSFEDGFFFSVQTLGTIGYGAMFPVGRAANALVTLQSFMGLGVLALATGLIFAKFSVPRSRVVWSRTAVINVMDGVPTLTFRVGNERGNRVVEAQIRLVLMRTEVTQEGQTLYRMRDLTLARDRTPAFVRTWTVLHPITPQSPMFGATPESLAEVDGQLLVTLVGVDGTTSQTIHASHLYNHSEIEWGARHTDMMSDLPEGRTRLDFGRFHDTEATAAAELFPYPRAKVPPPA